MTTTSNNKVFFPDLDAIRTIAFLFVFSEHVFWSAFKQIDIQNKFLHHIAYNLFANGGLGVSVFFVLSGFLITFLILKEIELNKKLDLKSFYIRRTLRIWPLYFAVVFFVLFLYPYILKTFGNNQLNPANPLMYYTFLSNFDMIRIDAAGLSGHMQSGITWSVAIEEQFYLFWPLLFLLLPKRRFVFIFPFFILLTLYFRYLYHNNSIVIYFHTLAVCADLSVGGLLAWLCINNRAMLEKLDNIKDKTRMLIYVGGISWVILANFFITWQYAPVFLRLINTLFFGWVIYDQSYNISSRFKLRNNKILSYWGKYTYGLYLLHPIAVIFIKISTDYFDIESKGFIPKSILAIITLLLTLILSYYSYHLFEKPFLKFKSKFSYISR